MKNKMGSKGLSIAAIGLVFSTLSFAQGAPDAGTLLQGTEGKAVPAPTAIPPIDVRKQPEKKIKAPAGLKVAAQSFRVTGATVFSEAELVALLEKYKGKELDLDDLQVAADTLANYYKSHGYFLAHAYLPAQKIEAGAVTFAVLEGRIGEIKIRMAEDAKINEETARRFLLENIKSGDLITEHSLEFGLLLLNDLPGVTVKSTLTPGKEVGTTDLVVSVGEGGRFSGQVEYDNFGQQTTGTDRFGGSVSLNSPLGIGDQLSVRALDTSTGGLKYARVGYTLPVGHLGTRLGVAQTNMEYRLGGAFEALREHGKADITNVFALHPLYRTRNLNVFAELGYDDKTLKDYTDATYSQIFKSTSNVVATIFGDSRDAIFGGGMNTYSLSYTFGHISLDTPSVKAIDQGAGGLRTHGGFGKGSIQLSRLQNVTSNVALYVAFNGQTASKNLDTSEKLSLGGPFAVRAYPQGEAPVDEGYIVTGELRYGLGKMGYDVPGNFGLAAFVDSARGDLSRLPRAWDTANRTGRAGGGVGLTWGEPGDFMVRVSAAWRIGGIKATADVDRDPRVTLDAVKWF